MEGMEKLNIIVKMEFGSRLYGTDTPESDLDYKGIFLPTPRDLILGVRCKSIANNTKTVTGEKNTSEDVDIELYSLHYFLELACKGETVALDMLYAHGEVIIECSWIWDSIVSQRKKFHTKNCKAFVGYARRQAAKYGIKGSRLAAAKMVLSLIPNGDGKMSAIWDKLPESEHLYHIEPSPNGIRQYQVCGKIIQETQAFEYTRTMLEKFLSEYGARARLAEQNEGVDWKAVSHALRAAYQVRELLVDETITMPRPEATYLLSVKNGELPFKEVLDELERLMVELEHLAETSTLPEKVNRKHWTDFIVKIYEVEYGFDLGSS